MGSFLNALTLKAQILTIVFVWFLLSCQSKASEEPFTPDANSEESYREANASKTTKWLSKMKASLLEEYQAKKSFEAKNSVLEKYEMQMRRHIQASFHNVLDSVTVRVDDIDSTIKPIYYIHFSDSLADYSYSLPLQKLKTNPNTFRLIRKLHEGAITTIKLQVQSIKLNDPKGPLAIFEMEAIPLPLK